VSKFLPFIWCWTCLRCVCLLLAAKHYDVIHICETFLQRALTLCWFKYERAKPPPWSIGVMLFTRAGVAESCRASRWCQVAWLDEFRHRSVAMLSVQCSRWPQVGRGQLWFRLRSDILCGVSVWLWAARAGPRSAVPARVSCRMRWPVAQGQHPLGSAVIMVMVLMVWSTLLSFLCPDVTLQAVYVVLFTQLLRGKLQDWQKDIWLGFWLA